MIVHQFVPTLEPGAVGAHTLVVRDVLRAAGHDVRDLRVGDRAGLGRSRRPLVARRAGPRRRDRVPDGHRLDRRRRGPGPRRTDRREPSQPHPDALHRRLAARRRARRGVGARAAPGAGRTGPARHRRLRLQRARPHRVGIHAHHRRADPPRPLHPRRRSRQPNRRAPTAVTWLFVGRLAPNKAQHDIVKAFAAYRRFHNPDARLHLVGGGREDGYARTLRRFVHALGLDDAVTLTGGVSPAELVAYYRAADVFVVCSEHEGFCVPLLEAMHHRVPIVAFASTAVPETLGDAGLLLDVKDPCTVAAAVDRVVTDAPLREQLVDAGARPGARVRRDAHRARRSSKPSRRAPRRREARGRHAALRRRGAGRRGNGRPVARHASRRGTRLRSRSAHHVRARRHHVGRSLSARFHGARRRARAPLPRDAARRSADFDAPHRPRRAPRAPSGRGRAAGMDRQSGAGRARPHRRDRADATPTSIAFHPFLYHPTVAGLPRVAARSDPASGRARRARATAPDLPARVRCGGRARLLERTGTATWSSTGSRSRRNPRSWSGSASMPLRENANAARKAIGLDRAPVPVVPRARRRRQGSPPSRGVLHPLQGRAGAGRCSSSSRARSATSRPRIPTSS